MSPAECPTFASDLASGLQDTLASKLGTRACSCSSILQFANGPKRTMGHVLGAEKDFFLIRGDDAAVLHGGRASGNLSIHDPEVSLGSPRVDSRCAQSPMPHTLPLPAYFGQFSHQCGPQNHE